jgi:hypothetical protein
VDILTEAEGSVFQVIPAAPGVDSYVELRFPGNTRTLQTGDYLNLSCYIEFAGGGATPDPSNDYSFDSKLDHDPWDHITVWCAGERVWGVEPWRATLGSRAPRGSALMPRTLTPVMAPEPVLESIGVTDGTMPRVLHAAVSLRVCQWGLRCSHTWMWGHPKAFGATGRRQRSIWAMRSCERCRLVG